MTLPVLTAVEVREAEQQFPQLLADGTLMQRASMAVASECFAIFREIGGIAGRRVLLLVGSGDNGGDALFAGARMAQRGVAVYALPVYGHMHEAGTAALRDAGGREVTTLEALALFDKLDLVIDGIVGLGSSRALEGDAALIARAVADAQLPVVSIDVPSGVDTDTGAIPGVAVDADVTVTFGALRRAHVVPPAALLCGDVFVADIGVPMQSADVALTNTGGWFEAPAQDATKYSRGVVGVVTGSAQYPGAALLSVGGALHSGAGMVRYFGPVSELAVARHPEIVVDTEVASASKVHAWVIGCGMGTGDSARTALREVLRRDEPVLVDADAITMLATDFALQEAVGARFARGALTLLTPHTGEATRIAQALGLAVDLDADRLGGAQAIARALQCAVLLKGPVTLVTDGARFVATPVLNAQLATAGSGDVLAGLIGGMMARHAQALTASTLLELAAAAAIRHSEAALTDDTTASDLVVGLEDAISATMAP